MEKWLPDGVPCPPPAAAIAGGERAARVSAWPEGRSRPWLTDVGGGLSTPIPWFMEGVRAFLDQVAEDLADGSPRAGRDRPLIALPVVGTSAGGARDRAGLVVDALMAELYGAVSRHGYDVVLVCWDALMLAAAHAAREVRQRGRPPELPEDVRDAATRLASAARRGELVLFLGAGVSAGAGLPLWGTLLTSLAEVAGLDDDARTRLEALDPLDQAAVIERRLGSREALTRALAALMARQEVSLAHALLAGLPVREVVTTNYDQLFERASRGAGTRTAVLPWEPAAGADRWLLKLHGSVEQPQDVVLTRRDYMRWSARRAALAGIVQALLITRHMLFVGFSLTDDNFHRIVDAVRQALPDDRTGPMGTALMLGPTPLLQELWSDDLRWVPVGAEGDPLSRSARELEILLDRLGARSSSTASHLLDPRYDPILSDGEREVRTALEGLADELKGMSRAAQRTEAWARVRALLRDLGET